MPGNRSHIQTTAVTSLHTQTVNNSGSQIFNVCCSAGRTVGLAVVTLVIDVDYLNVTASLL